MNLGSATLPSVIASRAGGEVQVALLNLTDRDYRLNPLNLYSELPRERTFAASLKFNF